MKSLPVLLARLSPGARVLFAGLFFASLAYSQQTDSPLQRGLHAYQEAKRALDQTPDNVEVSWKFARACFDCADLFQDNDRRADFATQAIAACRRAAQLNPKSGPVQYYLGLNLGQLARTRTLGALKLVSEMEEVFLTAIKLSPAFDHAGPHRSLGLLYLNAPGWPLSVGSDSKARKHLRRAVALSPGYPDNEISLLEAYVQWGDEDSARARLPKVRAALHKARDELSGPDWETSWNDWDQRWAKLEKRL